MIRFLISNLESTHLRPRPPPEELPPLALPVETERPPLLRLTEGAEYERVPLLRLTEGAEYERVLLFRDKEGLDRPTNVDPIPLLRP